MASIKSIQTEEFSKLLELSIGKNRSQNDFAKQAGISQEHLNRMLRHPEKTKPSVATLKKIAEASNGRVDLNRLEKSCGYDPSQIIKPDDIEPVGEFYDAKNIILEYKKGVMEFCGRATRYDNIHDILDTVEILFGRSQFRYTIENEEDFTGHGHFTAEKTANITVEFATDQYKCSFGFVMFYCETTHHGIIFSDAAFDLLTLNDFKHSLGTKKLIEISTIKDVDRSKYQTVYFIKKFRN